MMPKESPADTERSLRYLFIVQFISIYRIRRTSRIAVPDSLRNPAPPKRNWRSSKFIRSSTTKQRSNRSSRRPRREANSRRPSGCSIRPWRIRYRRRSNPPDRNCFNRFRTSAPLRKGDCSARGSKPSLPEAFSWRLPFLRDRVAFRTRRAR